ncbi:ATP-binding protein [Pseudomonas sp. KSR10]|uniref:AAA family ATPase n=1 Tax=Pseudomonas sp. KSR10 TaxID=2916654 RepID=UPI001EF9B5C8|nr:ATP-binding protein [Pseudomonas sp. KSR10]MCG6541954.1 ATP-binding protein [Pseudomonas sp. KSR10]
MKLLTSDEIDAAYAQVEAVDEGRVGPDRANYLALSDADFELLLYSIYQEPGPLSAWYSNVRLMVTGADQGRDVWLTKDEQPVGLIQCKKVKAGFTRPDSLREVIKFLLNVVLEPALMPDPAGFRFILALASDPASTAADFFEAPQTWLTANEAELLGLVADVIKKYEAFSTLRIEAVMPGISMALKSLKYELLRPVDLDALLEGIPAVRQRFFKVQLVVAVEDAEAMIEARFAAVGLVSKSIEIFTRADVEEDITRGSRGLADWPQLIWGQHIERSEFDDLLQRINQHPAGSTLVVGGAGTGKSALLAELYCALKARGQIVLAIKADMLSPNIVDFADLARDLGMSGDIEQELLSLAVEAPVVLIIDQLDAVSEVMDQSSQRMQVLLRLASRLQEAEGQEGNKLPIHVIVSSRPFEAKFDARFRLLDADELLLSLPPFERISALLGELGIDATVVPDSLKETLRTAFALGIYVDLAKSGLSPADLTAANLLDRWLDKKLPAGAARVSCMAFLRQLATDMTQHESLWRPAAHYHPDYSEMLRWSESIGIVIREDASIGFSHQSWLDDFQAKTLRTAQGLADYAWSRQEGLFARGTILRGLEQMRRVDMASYEVAIRLLLPNPKTRRHLRHLVADYLASADDPSVSDTAWVDWMARNDHALADRAFRQVALRWPRWRSGLLPLLPFLLQDEKHSWNASMLLAREVAEDSSQVMDLVDRYWSDASHDGDVFSLFERSGIATDRAIAHVRTIFNRTVLADWAISHYAKTLHENGNTRVALDVISFWATLQPEDRHNGIRVYGAEKIAAAAPLYCAERLLPWFVGVASREVADGRPGHRYPQSIYVPYDWKYDGGEGHLTQLLRSVLEESAVSDPDGACTLLATVVTVEIDEVQSLVADTLAANPALLNEYALAFLLADQRRLNLGSDTFDDEEGVGQMICGWSSSNLIALITPYLSLGDIERIRDYIESWEPWKEDLQEERDPAQRRKLLRWSDERRLRLLAELPVQVLTARRRRQVEEWKVEQPALQAKRGGRRMAQFVGSPMSHDQMAKASDDAIIKMLDEVNDHTGRHEHPKHWQKGGVTELSRAFAAFAKSFPDRALRIIPRLQPDLHEQVTGAAIRELSAVAAVDAQALKILIWDAQSRGFSLTSFRHDVASAMEALAKRLKGLEGRDIELLRGWLQRDPNVLAAETLRHGELNKSNRERNEKPDQRPEAMLFGRGGGMHFLPQRNFTLLSAIAAGYIHRDGVDCDGWLAELELHVTHPEDPEVWTAILAFRSHELWWADAARVSGLIEAIWRAFPATFEDAAVVQSLWRLRVRMHTSLQQEIVNFWLSHSDHKLRQIGGEFSAASVIVDGTASCGMGEIVEAVMAGNDISARSGVLFAAAAGWSELDLDIRSRSHAYLISVASIVSGFEAHALSTAVDRGERLPPDEMTRALLASVAVNNDLLKESMGRLLVRSLQHLLLYPSFEMLVLHIAEAATELARTSPDKTVGGLYDGEFIGLVIALQRSPLEVKTRAMTIYERLLDAEVYGAEDAAAFALRR